KGKIRSSEILEKNMPFIVQPQGDQDTTFINIRVRPINENQLYVTDLVTSEKINVLFGKTVLIGNNRVIFQKNPVNPLETNGVEYLVNVVPKDWAIDANLSSISITPSKEMQSYVVNFSMESTLDDKAELVLNSLIDVYNEDLTTDKLRMTRATSDFINKRLVLISKDLSGADEQAAEFKASNSMIDMTTEAGVFLNSAS